MKEKIEQPPEPKKEKQHFCHFDWNGAEGERK